MDRPILTLLILVLAISMAGTASAQEEECPRGAAPTIDGTLSEGEWDDAGFLEFTIPVEDTICHVFHKHDGSYLYVGFDIKDGRTTNVPDTRVMLDLDNDAAEDPQDDDYELYINPDNGGTRERRGNGGGWTVVDETGWTGAWDASQGDVWSTEYSIAFRKLQGNNSGVLGIGFIVYGNWGTKGGWPDGADEDSPASWGNMTFEGGMSPGRPRVALRGGDLVEVTPGSRARSQVMAINGGDETVTLSFTIEGDVARWVALSPSSLTLRGGTNDTVTMTVSAPGNATAGDRPLTVMASTRADGVVAWLNVTVRVVEGPSGGRNKDDGGLPGFEVLSVIAAFVLAVALTRRRRH